MESGLKGGPITCPESKAKTSVLQNKIMYFTNEQNVSAMKAMPALKLNSIIMLKTLCLYDWETGNPQCFLTASCFLKEHSNMCACFATEKELHVIVQKYIKF